MNTRILHSIPRPITRLSDSQYKRLERRLHYSFPKSTRHPPNIISNPRSARIRIWWKDIRTHRRQVATIKAVKRQIAEMKYTQAVALFNNSARLHGLTIGPQVINPCKCPYSPDAIPHRSNFKLFISTPKKKKRHKQDL